MAIVPEPDDELEYGDEYDEEADSWGWPIALVGMALIALAVLCRVADFNTVAFILFWIGTPVLAVGLAYELITRPQQFLPGPWD